MKKGFTLIELMVVVAIIMIISGIVIASLSSVRAKSRDGKRISDISQIQLALELYYEQNRTYPTAIYGSVTPAFEGIYNSTTPKDPNTANYKYATQSSGGSIINYHLGALVEQVAPSGYNTNSDFDSSGAGWTNGFMGLSTDCANTSATTASDKCYDVKGR